MAGKDPSEVSVAVAAQETGKVTASVGMVSLLVGLVLLLTWSYWPVLREIAQRWAHDPQYSHGYLVPLVAVALFWIRARQPASLQLKPTWSGLVLVALAAGMRFAGTYLFYTWLEAGALVVCVAGLVVVLWGWSMLKRNWAAIAYLVFMLPLPYRVEVLLSHPLRALATSVSTYALQTCGFPAVAEGNVIIINHFHIGVAEACSGLAMLLTFLAICAAVVLVLNWPWPDGLLILISAIPIAIIANVVRIVVTGLLLQVAGSAAANMFFHDLAGWLMMPLGMLMVWLEVWFLSRLFVRRKPADEDRILLGIPAGVKAAMAGAGAERSP